MIDTRNDSPLARLSNLDCKPVRLLHKGSPLEDDGQFGAFYQKPLAWGVDGLATGIARPFVTPYVYGVNMACRYRKKPGAVAKVPMAVVAGVGWGALKGLVAGGVMCGASVGSLAVGATMSAYGVIPAGRGIYLGIKAVDRLFDDK